MLERFDARLGRQYRGFHDSVNALRPDGTILSFGGGDVALNSNEWFNVKQVEEVFIAFLERKSLPANVHWRDITDSLIPTSTRL